MNPPLITLGHGAYSVASATTEDGTALLTFQKLKAPATPGELLAPKHTTVGACDLVVAITNRPAAEVLLAVAAQIAGRFGFDSVEAKLTQDILFLQARMAQMQTALENIKAIADEKDTTGKDIAAGSTAMISIRRWAERGITGEAGKQEDRS